jgi:hypothetical protein
MCGQIGVSSTAGSAGCRIGPPAARLYAVEPVGAERGDEQPVDRDVQLDDARERGLGDHDVVQHVLLRVWPARAPHGRVEQPPLLEAHVAGQQALERGVELAERDVGEEAEAAEVHAEHGHAPLAEQLARAQQRAVAAQHQQRLGALGERVAGQHLARPLPLVQQQGGLLLEQRPDAARLEPREQLAQRLAGLQQAWAREDPDRLHAATAAAASLSISSGGSPPSPFLSHRKNSRLPVAPRTAEARASSTA